MTYKEIACEAMRRAGQSCEKLDAFWKDVEVNNPIIFREANDQVPEESKEALITHWQILMGLSPADKLKVLKFLRHDQHERLSQN